MELSLTKDLEYLIVFSLVLILPKILLRFKIPSGITALGIGLVFSVVNPALGQDQLFRFLSQIGITSLFLFAGLEVEFDELKEDRVYLSKFLTKNVIALFLLAAGISFTFVDSFQDALVLSLGLLTPSAGFIMTSLHAFKVSEDHEYWIKSKAISKEILAVVLLFFALQGDDLVAMGISLLFFAGLFLILPFVLRKFFMLISPFAPNSEVPFLVTIALISGVISKELGTYYLVGAFVVGLICSRLKKDLFSDKDEQMFSSLSSFFTVFLPFYFFYAGVKLSLSDWTWTALLWGVAISIVFVPARIFMIRSSIKSIVDSSQMKSYQISLSLMPTLIFGLVIAGILRQRGVVSPTIIFALITYTLLTSLLPSIIFSLRSVLDARSGSSE